MVWKQQGGPCVTGAHLGHRSSLPFLVNWRDLFGIQFPMASLAQVFISELLKASAPVFKHPPLQACALIPLNVALAQLCPA